MNFQDLMLTLSEVDQPLTERKDQLGSKCTVLPPASAFSIHLSKLLQKKSDKELWEIVIYSLL